jgi:hypothetical protein
VSFLHNLLHRHTLAVKAGLGTFSTCAWRLGDKCVVTFQPDLTGADWHLVPCERNRDGTLLFERMLQADSPHEAMALLRAAGES